MPVNPRLLIVLLTLLLACGPLSLAEKSEPATDSASLEQQKAALQEFNDLIGGWKGVGMPKRGSQVGAWIEEAEWVWHFDKDTVALDYDITKGETLFKTARLTWLPATKQYQLVAELTGGGQRTFLGRLAETKLMLDSSTEDGWLYRITVTRLNDKRTLVLHEKRRDGQSFYSRIAEVGYTRAGTLLAVEGQGEPICVVTGGKGTTKVTYKGEEYYVCCTGCKQAFDDDPEGIIAAYKAKLKEKAAK